MPLLRNDRRENSKSVDWDAAMQIFSVRFKAIQDQWGTDPAAVAFLSTGQIVH